MKTAVEWFFEQIMYADVDIKVWREIYDQAKEMEREQIVNAYIESGANLEDIIKEEAENYYKKTFK